MTKHSVAAPGVECWLGRQPIVDRASRLRGYELLYRDGPANRATFADGDLATYHVLSRAVIDLGLDRLVGPHLAFLNVTGRILTGGGYRVLPADRTVLEVLEDVEIDDQVLAGAEEATDLGFKLALDDYVGDSRLEKLAGLLSYVKVDVRAVAPRDLPALVDGIRSQAPQAVLLAEKVETASHIQRCRDLGFQLFQGYFVGRPEPQVGRQVPARSVAALRLVAELQRPDLSLEQLDAILRTDPILAYRLMRMVNSAAMSSIRRRPISSIRHAVIMTGIAGIQRLATILALTTISGDASHMVESLVVRAKMCQTIAELHGLDDGEAAFTAGLFSGLDLLLGEPMERILDGLALAPALREALANGRGALGELVHTAIEYETAQVDVLARHASLAEWQAAFLGALEWAALLRDEMQPGPD